MQVEIPRGSEATQERARTGHTTGATQPVRRPKINSYSYSLVTSSGIRMKGKVRALSEDQARALALISQPGGQILKLRKVSDLGSTNVGGKAVKYDELVIFTRQLATFVKAGVPLVESLASIGSENATRAMQDCLREISMDLAQGLPLSTAMSKHKRVFPAFYLDLVRAGEITGNLDMVLQRAAAYLQRITDTKRKIRSALAYPIVIGIFALFAIIVLVVFVLPNFVTFFESFDAKLPAATRIVLAVSDFLQTWWFVILLLIAIGVTAFILALRVDSFRYRWNKFTISMPMAGPLIRFTIIERFCATLATMVQAGVPITQTFNVVIEGSKNLVFQRALKKVQTAMMQGQGISGPLAATGMFPSMVPQMIKVGEDTGTLDDQLMQAAQFYSEELEHRLAKFTALFEPLIIIFLGGIVGFIGYSLVSAMYDIYNQVGG